MSIAHQNAAGTGPEGVEPPRLSGLRIAIVHDWLTGLRGGERVLQEILALLPAADLYCLFHDPAGLPPDLASRLTGTSWLQRLPGIRRHYRKLLPLMPLASRGLDLVGYDLVLSISHCAAVGVKVDPGTRHLAYVLSPMRYAWDRFDDYLAAQPVWTHPLMHLGRRLLRHVDRQLGAIPERLICISEFVRDRIRRCWGREASVIYPTVDLDRFVPGSGERQGDVVLSAMVPYKRIDLAIAAYNQSGRPLTIIGDGPLRPELEQQAGPTIRFTGHVPDARVAELLASARLLIVPQVEDLGLVALEAMAAGCPVVAYAEGGVRELLGTTGGLLFADQTPDSLNAAVAAFEADPGRFSGERLQVRAAHFGRERFRRDLLVALGEVAA